MATVTIAQSYFDALLRRAEFYSSSHEPDASPSLNYVTIPKAEHDYLCQAYHEYNVLKDSLLRGGLSQETLDTILAADVRDQDEESPRNSTAHETFGTANTLPVNVRHHSSHGPVHGGVNGGGRRPTNQGRPNARPRSSAQMDSFADTDRDDDLIGSPDSHIQEQSQRSIIISNVSERATHKDIVDKIRGGRVIEMYFRNDRSVIVTFSEGAQDFMAYAKRCDIYLHQKRLEFRWNRQQFQVNNHVLTQMAKNGVTRNLVIRGADVKQITPAQIREDLDHIHNLVVIDIKMINGDAHVSTNSVHNALFARTCMLSRTAYRGLRIDWDPDECAEPIPAVPRRAQTSSCQAAPRPAPLVNRYTVLDTGATDSDSDGDTKPFVDGYSRLDRAVVV